MQQLRIYFNRNDKIKAIKYLKKLTTYNLKETKEIIDKYFHNPASINNFEYELIEVEIFEKDTQTAINKDFTIPTLNESDLGILAQLVQKGQKLNAVKIVKDKLDISLKDAKEYIDNFHYKEDNSISTKKEDPIFKKQDDEVITFEKMNKRDKKRRKTKSNSVCMLTLSLFFIIGIIITGSIIYLS